MQQFRDDRLGMIKHRIMLGLGLGFGLLPGNQLFRSLDRSLRLRFSGSCHGSNLRLAAGRIDSQTDSHLMFPKSKQALVARIQHFHTDCIRRETKLRKSLGEGFFNGWCDDLKGGSFSHARLLSYFFWPPGNKLRQLTLPIMAYCAMASRLLVIK